MALSLPPESYLWFKTFHIIGVVVWFAGLFYLVRLFIYHVEAAEQEQPIRAAFEQQYGLMERRLANIITTPGMAVAVSCAVGLLVVNPSWLQQSWMHAKLLFVAFLLGYHWLCYRLMGQLQRGECNWSGRQLRALNELPTLLLVIVVLLVVFKQQFPTGAATWLTVGLVVFMAASIQFYARWRRLRAEREAAHAG
ncbi:protoporphyrinogen IX oxidase [Synechococcus sp. Minos11]|jgi:putative membrane protein|uniref:protoporphyrinogen oxidase HemJ n=1 Tax=Synechococcus sp. Minos11 TaxID=221341 RepID=UPI000B6E3B24|nr:protoporphyrinogen oxidase HemJ [Synechococcus sp. Minos11]MDA7985556.1 protoporphyrinogen oxidase HemJ [Synechococcus sp. H1_metabat_bins_2.tsv.006]MEC8605238.1 protoporphyrinogen oxidase HemJ [Cyanobacteriota bacterium]OUW41744.1 MAG: TIGR00701 family protein [Synechococcus sp. TMED185]RCL62395.1 MAG: protoporphyrinogen oxidase HemJ [Synechococcus sp. MED-G67]HCA60831.1 protoporphyrinogen oxidase HemJ [Synechococcales bacterium UBA8647]HCV57536.1 protoporphyrinogen oxidase HemJ [Synechoc|tara:strand:- start:532 stop:1116 length:585 start_codon:yes stop_codon:yes gene_type:complete